MGVRMLGIDAMPFSDRLLLEFFHRIQANGVRLRYLEIAEQTGVSKATVCRSITRLHAAGLISITREPGDSYTYQVTNDQRTA